MREFDCLVTASLHGFWDEYYARASSSGHLDTTAVQTWILHTRDHPILDLIAIPTEERFSPTTVLELSEARGHAGLVASRTPVRPAYCLNARIAAWLRTCGLPPASIDRS